MEKRGFRILPSTEDLVERLQATAKESCEAAIALDEEDHSDGARIKLETTIARIESLTAKSAQLGEQIAELSAQFLGRLCTCRHWLATDALAREIRGECPIRRRPQKCQAACTALHQLKQPRRLGPHLGLRVVQRTEPRLAFGPHQCPSVVVQHDSQRHQVGAQSTWAAHEERVIRVC